MKVTSDIPLSTSLWGFEMAVIAIFVQRNILLKFFIYSL